MEAEWRSQSGGEGGRDAEQVRSVEDGGIDINDPILRYDFNHFAATLGKSEVAS